MFIAVVAAVALFCAQQPDGRARRGAGRRALSQSNPRLAARSTCDDDVPIGIDGRDVRVHASTFKNGDRRATIEFKMNREGSIDASIERAPAEPRIKKTVGSVGRLTVCP